MSVVLLLPLLLQRSKSDMRFPQKSSKSTSITSFLPALRLFFHARILLTMISTLFLPGLRACLTLLAACIAVHAPVCAQNSSSLGPRISFERIGARVCATYVLDGSHDLYRARIFAMEGHLSLSMSDLPPGKKKNMAGVTETVIDKNFTSCSTASSPSAAMRWIDQSCLSSAGICLPPRGFEVGANGRFSPLAAAEAARIFSANMAIEAGAAPSKEKSEWSFSFKP